MKISVTISCTDCFGEPGTPDYHERDEELKKLEFSDGALATATLVEYAWGGLELCGVPVWEPKSGDLRVIFRSREPISLGYENEFRYYEIQMEGTRHIFVDAINGMTDYLDGFARRVLRDMVKESQQNTARSGHTRQIL